LKAIETVKSLGGIAKQDPNCTKKKHSTSAQSQKTISKQCD